MDGLSNGEAVEDHAEEGPNSINDDDDDDDDDDDGAAAALACQNL